MKIGTKLGIYLLFIVIAIIITVPFVRVSYIINSGKENSQQSFSALCSVAEEVLRDANAVNKVTWHENIKKLWNEQSNLLAVVVEDNAGNIFYAKPSSSAYYVHENDRLTFVYPKFSAKEYTRLSASGVKLSALYTTLTQKQLFNAVRDAGLCLLVVLLVLGAYLFISSKNIGTATDKESDEETNKRSQTTNDLQEDASENTDDEKKILDFEKKDEEEVSSTLSKNRTLSYEAVLAEDENKQEKQNEELSLYSDSVENPEAKAEPNLQDEQEESELHIEVESASSEESTNSEQETDNFENEFAMNANIEAAKEKDSSLDENISIDDENESLAQIADRAVNPNSDLTKSKKDLEPVFVDQSEIDNQNDVPQGLFDPETGLCWEAYLRDRLEAELNRSASFEQDLTICLIKLGTVEKNSADFSIFAETTKNFFSFKDMAFVFGDDGIAIILPNMDVEHALRMCEEYIKKLTNILGLKYNKEIYIGLSSRAGRLISADRFISEALASIKKAKKDGNTKIIAFKPDPERYRAFLSEQ